jgi:hypothetical protein
MKRLVLVLLSLGTVLGLAESAHAAPTPNQAWDVPGYEDYQVSVRGQYRFGRDVTIVYRCPAGETVRLEAREASGNFEPGLTEIVTCTGKAETIRRNIDPPDVSGIGSNAIELTLSEWPITTSFQVVFAGFDVYER